MSQGRPGSTIGGSPSGARSVEGVPLLQSVSVVVSDDGFGSNAAGLRHNASVSISAETAGMLGVPIGHSTRSVPVRVSSAIALRPNAEQRDIVEAVVQERLQRTSTYRRNQSMSWFPAERLDSDDDDDGRGANAPAGGRLQRSHGSLAATPVTSLSSMDDKPHLNDDDESHAAAAGTAAPPPRIRHPNLGIRFSEWVHEIGRAHV